MASMIAAMTLGVTLEQAVARGLVKTPRDREVWARLSDNVAAIEERGGKVEIPVEPLA